MASLTFNNNFLGQNILQSRFENIVIYSPLFADTYFLTSTKNLRKVKLRKFLD